MMTYLICYDISNSKRLHRVAKIAYAFALGGQKSALEAPLNKQRLLKLKNILEQKIRPKEDKINIVKVDDNPILLGKASRLIYDNGVIII